MVELIEGELYLVRARTTNMSTKAGVPVAATLTMNIAMGVNSQVIMEDSRVYGFAAGQTHTFGFHVTVPLGTGGKAGSVVAEVLDPGGNKLADGSLDIVIASIVPVETYISGGVKNAMTGIPLSGVLFSMDGYEVIVDGIYKITDLTPGSYTITLQKEGFETITRDIVLVEGDNHFNFQMVPLAFDPWFYDINGDGIIDALELVKAWLDYKAGRITEEQYEQVKAISPW